MRRIFILAFLLIAIAFILLTDHFDKKKTIEYKDDERWHAIKSKVNNIILKFFNVIVVIVCLGMLYFGLIHDSSPSITVIQMFQLVFHVMMLRYPVEYFALRYYDGKL